MASAHSGEALYKSHCMQCHGEQLQGGRGSNLADKHGGPAKAAIANVIRNGFAGPGHAGLESGSDTSGCLESGRLHENARAMTLSPDGIVFVGSRFAGKVYAVIDSNKDFVADQVVTVADKLDSPIGVAFLNGALYVSEMSRVIRFDDIANTYASRPKAVVVKDDFPKDRGHGEKIIKAGPDGKIYVPIGAPCNVCIKEKEPHTKIWRMNPDGSQFEVYAQGVRNSVGFAWHPQTKELWFTDNGRDQMGDNLPPDELNHAPNDGPNFGFPYCHAGVVADPEFGKVKSCSEFVPPAMMLGPHVADGSMLISDDQGGKIYRISYKKP